MKISQAIFALHFVDPKLDFSESMILVFLQVGKRNFKYPPLQRVIRILETSGSVYECFPNATDLSFRLVDLALYILANLEG